MAQYFLMNHDRPVVLFEAGEYIKNMTVLNNMFLPFSLRDYVQTTKYGTQEDGEKSAAHIAALTDFLCARLLNLSRSGAKEILNAGAFPQSLKTKEKLYIVLECRALSMTDGFWLRKPEEELAFDDVCLRKQPLSNKSYDIAIQLRHISATREELRPDISASGMFPKFWRRGQDGIPELWKTDRMGFVCTEAELAVSEILDSSDVPHVEYRREEKDGMVFAVSECFTDDRYSFASAQDILDWMVHTGQEGVGNLFPEDFANMVCLDYLFANTDRHTENFGFLIDDRWNKIVGMAPLFDHNQALVADGMGTDIEDLIYEPTGKSFAESVQEYAANADFLLDARQLSPQCLARLQILERVAGRSFTEMVKE